MASEERFYLMLIIIELYMIWSRGGEVDDEGGLEVYEVALQGSDSYQTQKTNFE